VLVEFISNIDLLNIGNSCNQNCRQCYAAENGYTSSVLEQEIEKARKIISANKDSRFFIYPKEITTSPQLIDLISQAGQNKVLSNARIIEPRFIDYIIGRGIKRIKITLFGSEEEQFFWNGNSAEQYSKIKGNIRLCAEKGLYCEIFTIITPLNLEQLPLLCISAKELGVKRVNLLRVMPFGNASSIDQKYLIKEPDLEELMILTDSLKTDQSPYISFGPWFGPDFYGKSVWNYLDGQDDETWVATKTLCPVVDNQYAGISMKTDNVYWCYLLLSMPDAVIGTVDENGQIRIDSAPDFSRETMIKKLRGICSKDNCEYQKLCFGGCRSISYVMAKIRGEAEPEYAGMDMCRTQIRQRLRK